MKRVVLGLGSNEGNRADFLSKSCDLISCKIGKIVQFSRIYETEACGFCGNPFLNQVVVAQTTLSPEMLLAETQQIEQTLGRTEKSGRDSNGNPIYHNRTIDIDILWYEGECRNTPTLIIPHPRLNQRAFVLQPLAELFDNQVLPPFTISFSEMLRLLS